MAQNSNYVTDGINAARKSGLSDSQIYQDMKASSHFKNSFAQAAQAGLSDAEIARDLGLKFEPVDKGSMPTISVNAKSKNNLKGSRPEGFIIGAVNDIGGGINQWDMSIRDSLSKKANEFLGTNLDTGREARLTHGISKINKEYDDQRIASGRDGLDGARLSGNVAATITSPASIGRTIMGTFAKSAAVGSGIGVISFAKDTDERIRNTKFGAIGGAVGGVVGKKASDLIVRGVNAAKNNMRPGVRELVEEGEKHGVRTSVGDVGKNPHIIRTETVLDRTPFIGTGAFREAQQQEAKLATNKVVEKLQGKMSEANYKSLGKIQTAASNGDKNAQRIMDIVVGADGNLGKTLQVSAEIQSWRGHKLASNMFSRVEQQAGNAPVPATQMLKAIDDVIAADSKTIPNKELLAELNGIRNNWSHVNNPQNYRELKKARSRLGELAKEWGSAISPKPTGGLTEVRTAIDDDLANFALNSGKPALINEFKKANAFYRQLKGGEGKALANSMSSSTPDEIFKTFIQAGKGDKAANFYKSLDPKGQAALRYEMANQALLKATSTSKDEVFSPAKFAGEFEKNYIPFQNVFKGTDKAEMDGFVKLMRHVERAGQYSSNPTNGGMLLLPASGVGLATTAMSEPLTAAATVASVYGLSKLFTTATGRKILLAAKDLPPNSKGLENLLKMAQKLSTTTGSNLTKSNQ